MTKGLKIFDVLASFRVAAKLSGKKKGVYLLQLNMSEKTISSQYFKQSFEIKATAEYLRIEQEISEDTNQDVVLVQAESLQALKTAYPNYFADTRLFIEALRQVI